MYSVVKKAQRCTQRPYTILHQNANYQLSIINYQLNKMEKNSIWGKILHIVITVLTAIATTFGVTSCMGV